MSLRDHVKWVQLASYPKSGNTWIRHIIGELAGLPFEKAVIGGHRYPISDAEPIVVNGTTYRFFKHHGPLQETEPPVSIVIYIYRHPLAVFISSLNQMRIRNRRDAFIGGKVKTVDEIYHDGEMGYYFDRYMDQGGWEFYRFSPLTRTWYEHFDYWERTSSSVQKLYRIRYEDMLQDACTTFLPIARDLFNKGLEDLRVVMESVDAKTRPDGVFYWRREAEAFRDYLTEAQIQAFEERYRPYLQRMGYLPS